MNNFMVADISSILWSLVCWLLYSSAQGYCIGYFSNILSFRTASLEKQFCLSAILALSVMPVLSYFAVRAGGIAAGAVLTIILSILSVVICCIRWKSALRKVRWLVKHFPQRKYLVISFLAWVLFALLMLIDLQWHKNLYLSVLNMDYAKHVAVANAICRDGIPAANPFFIPAGLYQSVIIIFGTYSPPL